MESAGHQPAGPFGSFRLGPAWPRPAPPRPLTRDSRAARPGAGHGAGREGHAAWGAGPLPTGGGGGRVRPGLRPEAFGAGGGRRVRRAQEGS